MALIISADEIKKQLPHYSPDKAEAFHHESAREADKIFIKALKNDSYKEVILLSGGTASGKTEFLATQLSKKDCIVLDATLSTELGARNKIRQIIKARKKPIVYAVIPDDLKRAFYAFLNRDRKFSDAHFYKTHSGSRKTLLWIAKNYPDITINIVESSYVTKTSNILQFNKIELPNKEQLLRYLSSIQITESGIIDLIQ
ncbi:MAG TPA: hypothetical protein VE090_04035 [Methylomirabilota bacterium]|nr:hypothetical protein [Methylomirabilota bacterium]